MAFLSKVFRWFFILYLGLLPRATLAWYGQEWAMKSFYMNDFVACLNGGFVVLSFQNRSVEMIGEFLLSIDRTNL